MTTTPRRAAAGIIAALALTVPVAMGASATAAPDDKHGSKAPKAPKTKQLLKAIDVKDAQLERLMTATRTTALGDDVEAPFVSNMALDRTALSDLRSAAQAVGSTLDAQAVRKDLHAFRVVNYVLAGNILRQVETVDEALAVDPEAAAHLEAAVTAALAITAESTRFDVRDAREHLQLAKAEAEAEADEEAAPAPTV